jgi:uncharacterized phage protein (TIGR01671 family)
MKEIKFRAWDANIKAFHLWDSESQPYGNIFWSMTKDENMQVDQYTGLKDRNGKEIFEGDIVRVSDFFADIPFAENGEWMESSEDLTGVVIFEDGAFQIETPQRIFDIPLFAVEYPGIENLGNYYQNPELLKPEK